MERSWSHDIAAGKYPAAISSPCFMHKDIACLLWVQLYMAVIAHTDQKKNLHFQQQIIISRKFEVVLSFQLVFQVKVENK